MIEFVVEAGKFLLKLYEKDAEAKKLVLSIQSFIKVGAPEEARKCCFELIRLSHQHPDVYFLLATAQYELKEYDQCLRAIQLAIETESFHSYWELKGDALKDLARHQEAIDAYNQAIKLNPSSQSAKQKRDACLAMLPSPPSSQPSLLSRIGRLGNQDFGSFSSSITPPSMFSSISSSSASNIELRSAKGIDYSALENVLRWNRTINEWRGADELTAKLMLKVPGRENNSWLRYEDIKQFPCEDLRTIDQLWMHYSNSKFGFSIQKQIWLECGGEIGKDYFYDHEGFRKLAAKVGWYHPQKAEWRTYTEFMNSTKNAQNALPASLPCRYANSHGEFRFDMCTSEGSLFSKPIGLHVYISSLAQRLIECNR